MSLLPCLTLSDIISAPPSSQRGATDIFLGAFGKTPVVNDLTRDLPYISSDQEGNAQIALEDIDNPVGRLDVRWSVGKGCHSRRSVAGHVASARLRPDRGLALRQLLLDTEGGTVTDYKQFEKSERETLLGTDSADHWPAYGTLPLVTFFENPKDKYHRLEWVVFTEDKNDGIGYLFDAETDASTSGLGRRMVVWLGAMADKLAQEVRENYRHHG